MLLVFIPAPGAGSVLDWRPNVINIQNTPPGGPALGDRYIVDTVPTGAWVGQTDNIATWDGVAWTFTIPENGWATYAETPEIIYIFDGVTWNGLSTTPLSDAVPQDIGTAAAGIGTAASRDDHVHSLGTPGAPPDTLTFTPGVAGSSVTPAREDHRHRLATASPVTIGTANAGGTSTSGVRSDHVHAHGNQTSGSLHAVAVASGANGFISGADQAKLDSITASYRQSFVNGDLVAGVLSVTHSLGVRYNHVTIYDNSNQMITPDQITDVDANNITIDLTSFGAIAGTWNLVVGG